MKFIPLSDEIHPARDGFHPSGERPWLAARVDRAGVLPSRALIFADLRAINDAAARHAEKKGQPEIMDAFRMPHGVSDEALADTAESFAQHAEPLAAELIKRGLPADFVATLRARAAAFRRKRLEQGAGLGGQVSSGAALEAAVDEGELILRELEVLIPNLYRNDPARMAEWHTASHIERRPHRRKDKPAGAPPPTGGGTPPAP